MSTHPCLPLWIDDYDAATAHLTPAEDGVYGRLLRLAWRTPGCSLPNDPAWIARKIRLSAEDFDAIAKPVLDEFFKVQRGRLSQKRLRSEYDSISRKKAARQTAGKKGGDAKAQNNNDKALSNATVLPGDTRAFPEPSPDPKPEDKTLALFAVEAGEGPPPQRADHGAKRGARLKADWKLSFDNHAYAFSEGFSEAEITRMAENFRDYWTAASGAKAAKLDWSAAWRTWVRNQRDRNPRRASGNRVAFV